jgi:hypothetical protein
MEGQTGQGGPGLTPYQLELLERLKPLMDRLDPAEVTEDSGLRVVAASGSFGFTVRVPTFSLDRWNTEEGEALALDMTVERRDARVLALDLYASPTECLLTSGPGALVERHGDPGADAALVNRVVDLVEGYLAGITVIEEYDRRDRLIRTRFISRRDGLPLFGDREGALARLLWLGVRVARTETFHVRFLKEEPGCPTTRCS